MASKTGVRGNPEDTPKREVDASNALLKAAEITNAHHNWEDITGKVLEMLVDQVGCESAAVFMLDDDCLVPYKAVGGPESAKSFFYSIRPCLEEFPAIGHAIKRRQPFVVGRKGQGPVLPGYLLRYLAVKEAVVAPIPAREKVPGLIAANFERIPEGQGAVRILQGIACQMGVAYENARLYEDSQKESLDLAKKIEALKVLHEIDKMILSSLDKDDLLASVAQQVKRLVPADVGGVALLEEDGENYRFICGWRLDMVEGDLVPASDCPATPTLKSKKAHLRPRLPREHCFSRMDKAFRDAGCMSDMFVPIISKGMGVGFMRLGSLRVAGFSMEDVSAAEKLACHVGIALENARLIFDLEDMLVSTVKALSAAIDAKSPWTKGHSERVTEYATATARKMGLTDQEVERLRLAGLLHDVGKIGTYDVILDKTSRLTEEEFELVKKHPARGGEILAPIKQFKDIVPIIRSHHERMDGRGYPAGLKGDEIPLMARILSVADSYDSMTADRPYRPAPGKEYAVSEFNRCSSSQFDPGVVEAFLEII